jgi:hypothetical protein
MKLQMGFSVFFHPPNGHDAGAEDMVPDDMLNILYFHIPNLSTSNSTVP